MIRSSPRPAEMNVMRKVVFFNYDPKYRSGFIATKIKLSLPV